MAGLVRVNCFKTTVRKFSSALYITGDKAQNNFVVLTPHIDFQEQMKNRADLVKSIEARQLSICLDKVEKRWEFFKMIDDHKFVLESTKSEIYSLINKLKKEPEKNKDDLDKLELHVNLVKRDLKNVKEFSYGLEESANLAVLKLPNILHPKTPISDESVFHQFSEKPNSIDKSHTEIGRIQKVVEHTNFSLCFLKSDAALCEFALTNYFQTQLLNAGLVQFSNADFARSVVVEGCGSDCLDPTKVFTLDGSSSELNKLHLVGGASLCSFMAYFAKHTVQSTLLPLKYFSIGRTYKPESVPRDPNLFDLSQNTVAQIFVATEDDREKMNLVFESLVQQIIRVYEPLGYHFRLIYVPANRLEMGESLKVSVQMFSNYLQQYVDVGNLSVYDNYLSKRLLFTYTIDKERKFPKIIAGEVLNVQKLLGCALENNFSGRKPLLTDLLLQHM